MHLGDAQVNPWTLSFKDPDLERKFWTQQTERDMPLCLVYMALGIIMFAVFALLDLVLTSGAELHSLLVIRVVVCGLTTIISLSVLFPSVQKYLQWVLSVNLFTVGFGIIVMTCITEEPVRHLYYAGLPLVLVFMPHVNLFRFSFSAPTALFISATYIFCAIYVAPIDKTLMINNFAFLAGTMALSIWANYWNDFNLRSEFIQHHFLTEEKRQSDILRKKAEAGNHAKSEFLAIVSHELRTPLNAIIGFSDIIRKEMFGPIGNEKYSDYINDIVKSGNHLLNIINNILDLSKAEAGKLELQEDYISLPQVVQDVMHLSRQMALNKDINVNLDIPYKDIVINGDARHLRLMVANLMSNAIKFTRDGGHVDLSLRVTPQREVVLKVSDTGVGIAADDIEKVLEPFVQVESSMSRYHEGTGLGLPLVKQFVDLHDAELDIDSTLGIGTTVSVTFPARRFVECEPGSGSAPRLDDAV